MLDFDKIFNQVGNLLDRVKTYPKLVDYVTSTQPSKDKPNVYDPCNAYTEVKATNIQQ